MAGFDERELQVYNTPEDTNLAGDLNEQSEALDAAHKAVTSHRRCRVYVAGPMSQGNRVFNFGQAVEAMQEIIRMGAAPMVPQLSFLVERLLRDVKYGEWLLIDLAWVGAADVVLRLHGKSNGAEVECQYAGMLGIPVVHSLADLQNVIDRWQTTWPK